MHLRSITIHGFKSFARATTLSFGRELTAIVGPNGAGKSNVVDAIRWCLGEQSLKAVRGKKSADVLFAGTAGVPRASVAEVTLTLDNADRALPLDFPEVDITRRMYRDGEGEYLLAGQLTRLHDTSLLLAQANFGQRSFSIVAQGTVDHVINATPSERLQFFIEATGVRQYQLRRDQAVLKLEQTEENLAQAQARLAEITPVLRSLTRQVNRLRRREELAAELAAWQRTYYWHRTRAQEEERVVLYRRLAEVEAKQVSQRATVEEHRRALQELSRGQGRSEAFASLQAAHAAALAARDELARQLATARGQQASELAATGEGQAAWAAERAEQLRASLKQIEARLTAAQAAQAERTERAADAERQHQRLAEAFAAAERALLAAQRLPGGPDEPTLAEAVRRAADELREISREIRHGKLENEAAAQRLEQAAAALAELGRREPSAEAVAEAKLAFHAALSARDGALAELHERRGEAALAAREVAEAQAEQAATTRELRQLGQRGVAPTPAALAELGRALETAEQKLSQATLDLSHAHEAAEEREKRRAEAQGALQGSTETLAKADAEVNAVRVELARLDAQAEDLAAELSRELRAPADSLANDLNLKPTDEGGVATWAERISRLREQVSQVGGIDPEVTAEYEQLKGRSDFLTSQTSDLAAALVELRKVVQELDQVIERQFSANFKRINEEFNAFFRRLFSGGKASLKLAALAEPAAEPAAGAEPAEGDTNPEATESKAEAAKAKPARSPLSNVGIDIQALPPGKKVATVNALSGGERTLLSTALLCAIVACNPSPFVVMDEVDAALDEANAERLASIFEELNKRTQIIIITHNRVIMQHASALFGVTMGPDGVSRVLSLSLKDAEQVAA